MDVQVKGLVDIDREKWSGWKIRPADGTLAAIPPRLRHVQLAAQKPKLHNFRCPWKRPRFPELAQVRRAGRRLPGPLTGDKPPLPSVACQGSPCEAGKS